MRQVKGLITERVLGMDMTFTAVSAEVDAPLQWDATVGLDMASTIWTATDFGVGSDMMWDAMADAGKTFNDHFDLVGGYRAPSVDYADGGFVHDVVRQGPVVAGVLRF